jgi:hypothetical protein
MWSDLPIDLISRSPIARWAPIPLRLIVGYGFMEHGFAKLARGPDAFPLILQALGVPAPHLMGWLTILVEIFGGLAVLLGALVPLASIPMAAAAQGHWRSMAFCQGAEIMGPSMHSRNQANESGDRHVPRSVAPV